MRRGRQPGQPLESTPDRNTPASYRLRTRNRPPKKGKPNQLWLCFFHVIFSLNKTVATGCCLENQTKEHVHFRANSAISIPCDAQLCTLRFNLVSKKTVIRFAGLRSMPAPQSGHGKRGKKRGGLPLASLLPPLRPSLCFEESNWFQMHFSHGEPSGSQHERNAGRDARQKLDGGTGERGGRGGRKEMCGIPSQSKRRDTVADDIFRRAKPS